MVRHILSTSMPIRNARTPSHQTITSETAFTLIIVYRID